MPRLMTNFNHRRFDILDGMRGIAALLVMVYHYYMPLHSPWLVNPFIAVDFFFILSGFVLMHSYGDRLTNGMSIASYIARRIIRLYTLMAFGILLGVPGLALYSALGHTSFSQRDILASAVSNLAFLPYLNDKDFIFPDGTIKGELFPNDGPLWSIFFELLASLAFIYLVKMPSSALRQFCTGCFAAIVVGSLYTAFTDYGTTLAVGAGWGSFNVLGGFPRVFYGFSCGILLYRLRRAANGVEAQRFAFANLKTLLLYGLLASCLLFPYRCFGLFYLVAIMVIAPALVWFGSTIDYTGTIVTRTARFLGWLSYPVYCLHKPVLITMHVLDEKFNLASHTGISQEIGGIGVTLLLAIIVTKLFDEPARQWLTKRFDTLLNHPYGTQKS